ncbi:MAG TPA: hypothetical protein DDW17_03150 [Deltaproteobacteria bacterium]|nr:hypothetical protein [Deltaproteobacteria bacterium]
MNPNYLDQWIWEQIKKEASNDSDLQHFLRINAEEKFSRDILERFQTFKLRQIVDYATKKSPFYRELFSKYYVRSSLLRTPADLHLFPLTESKDIIRDPYSFLCVPMGEISRIISLSTSGTTGEKKRVFFTQNDFRRIVDLLAANAKAVLSKKQGKVQIMLPGGTIMGHADALARGVEKVGSTAIVTGAEPDVMKQVETIAKHGSIALVGYTFYLNRLTRLAGESYQLNQMGIKAIVTTGEPVPIAVRRTFETHWKAKVFSHYSSTEMGFNTGMGCKSGIGYHIHEADYLVEVVDPDTGQPLAEGEEGELVLTTLEREGMPLIRYKTGDLCRILPQKCICGSNLKRIDMIKRRIGTGIKFGTGVLHSSTFDENLFSIPMVLDYQLEVVKESDRVTLIFLVETVDPRYATGSILKKIEEVIKQHPLIHEGFLENKISVEVKFVSNINDGATLSHKRVSDL